jgi:predicted lipid carrier protein YhbT
MDKNLIDTLNIDNFPNTITQFLYQIREIIVSAQNYKNFGKQLTFKGEPKVEGVYTKVPNSYL